MSEKRNSFGLRKYLNHLDELQVKNVQLKLVCVFSAEIIGLLTFGMISMAVSLRDRPVVAVPGLKEIAVLTPGVYEKEMVYAFAEHVMSHLTNYNPETVAANFAYARRFFVLIPDTSMPVCMFTPKDSARVCIARATPARPPDG